MKKRFTVNFFKFRRHLIKAVGKFGGFERGTGKMHFDYKKDAPIEQVNADFLTKEELVRHRDIYMGEQAAALSVFTDGKDKCDAQVICRLPPSAFPRYMRNMLGSIREDAGGYVCHKAFFASIGSGGAVPAEARELIKSSFGSLEGLRFAFTDAAKKSREQGYLWIAEENMRRRSALKLVFTKGNSLLPPHMHGILCLDMWEHSYSGRYGCDRGAYAAAFLASARWERLVR